MAFPHAWGSSEDNQPTGSAVIGQVDDYIVGTRQMVRERIDLEHNFEFTNDAEQGSHRKGSARVWVSSTTPASAIPDSTEAEVAGTTSVGRVWFNPDTGVVKVHNGTTWVDSNITSAQVIAFLNALTDKTVPVDADRLFSTDSAASYAGKKFTFANLWTWILAKINALTTKGSAVVGDHVVIEDSQAANAIKRVSLSSIQTLFNASPAFTGAPTAVTAPTTTNTTQLATTAFTINRIAYDRPYETNVNNILMNGENASLGTSANVPRADHVHKTDSSRAAADHVHGAITNAGKIGTEADKVLITTTAGAITTTSKVPSATSADSATTAETANKIRTSAPGSPANGDIWIV